jgi:hypothetical protein
MYSGPFILWNFESPEMDADTECIPKADVDVANEKKKTK